jgi:hypothetical protein
MTTERRTWAKSSQQLIDLFYASLPHHPDVEKRKMFGCPCAFVNRNMFTGLHEENMFVRLPEPRRNELATQFNATHFTPIPGRAMKEYMVVPAVIRDNPDDLAQLVYESFEFASSLPIKK